GRVPLIRPVHEVDADGRVGAELARGRAAGCKRGLPDTDYGWVGLKATLGDGCAQAASARIVGGDDTVSLSRADRRCGARSAAAASRGIRSSRSSAAFSSTAPPSELAF